MNFKFYYWYTTFKIYSDDILYLKIYGLQLFFIFYAFVVIISLVNYRLCKLKILDIITAAHP